jgi:hypothetical protein
MQGGIEIRTGAVAGVSSWSRNQLRPATFISPHPHALPGAAMLQQRLVPRRRSVLMVLLKPWAVTDCPWRGAGGQIAVVWRTILLGGSAVGRVVKLGSDTKRLEELVPALPLKKLGCRVRRTALSIDRELS